MSLGGRAGSQPLWVSKGLFATAPAWSLKSAVEELPPWHSALANCCLQRTTGYGLTGAPFKWERAPCPPAPPCAPGEPGLPTSQRFPQASLSLSLSWTYLIFLSLLSKNRPRMLIANTCKRGRNNQGELLTRFPHLLLQQGGDRSWEQRRQAAE